MSWKLPIHLHTIFDEPHTGTRQDRCIRDAAGGVVAQVFQDIEICKMSGDDNCFPAINYTLVDA
jgi:hypothetical protein